MTEKDKQPSPVLRPEETTAERFERLLAAERDRLQKAAAKMESERRAQAAKEAARQQALRSLAAAREQRLADARGLLIQVLNELIPLEKHFRISKEALTEGVAFTIEVPSNKGDAPPLFAQRIFLGRPCDDTDVGVLVGNELRFNSIERLREYLQGHFLKELASAVARVSPTTNVRAAAAKASKPLVGSAGGLKFSNPNFATRPEARGPWCTYCWGMPVAGGKRCEVCQGNGQPLSTQSPEYFPRMFAAAIALQLDRREINRLIAYGEFTDDQKRQLEEAAKNAPLPVNTGDMLVFSSLHGQD